MRPRTRRLARTLAGVAVALGAAVAVPAGTAGARTTTTGSGQATGQDAARQILAEAPLPPGTRPTATVATHLLTVEPEPFLLPSQDISDAYAFYLVPSAPATVVAYVEHHLPRHWFVADTEPPNGPPPPGETIVQDQVAVSGPHDQAAQVAYTVVAGGPGTALRVDGQVTWNPLRPRDETVSRSGTVKVTAYRTSSLDRSSSGPVTVTVGGRAARRIRTAFDRLYRAAPSGCMENETVYDLEFFAGGSPAPVLRASDATCPTPGVVQVDGAGTNGGTGPPPLRADCALDRAVVAVLPAGRAGFTRSAASAACRSRVS